MICDSRPSGSIGKSCARRAYNIAGSKHLSNKEMRAILEEHGHSKECMKTGHRQGIDKQPAAMLESQ